MDAVEQTTIDVRDARLLADTQLILVALSALLPSGELTERLLSRAMQIAAELQQAGYC